MKKAAVIIENRNIKGLDKIIERHMYYLPDFKLVHFKNQDIKSRYDYNTLLTDCDLWEYLNPFDKVLIFQHDSEIFKPLDNEFLKYDYVGAPWFKGAEWETENRRGGNGGLSIRDVKAHYELTKSNEISPLALFKYPNEDIFFSHLLKNVAPYEVCKKFSVETEFNLGTFGAHAIDRHLTAKQCTKIRNYEMESI